MKTFKLKSKYDIGDVLSIKNSYRSYTMVVESVQFIIDKDDIVNVYYWPEEYNEDCAHEKDVVRKMRGKARIK